ncbi:hypothetical protein BC827DRAFT_351631 [Russula dissimulans]|nr:hypothetical protein BC827DRAFT_351631 [Russula dissimulans]
MFSPSSDSLLASLLLTMEPHSYHPNMSTYAEGSRLSYDPNSMSQEQKARVMLPFDYSMTSTDTYPVPLSDGSFTSPATAATIPDQTGFSAPFSSLTSAWGRPTLWARSPGIYSGIPGEVGQGAYYTAMSHSHNSPPPPYDGPSTFDGSFVTPSGPGGDAPTTQDIKPGQYYTSQWGTLTHLSTLKRPKCERTADQLGGQGMCDRNRFTCTIENCGKDFSGEWEKTRHIKSVHCPPTIGCRECNYKQSRKDLFSEHCRKRHPGESIEDLMVQLVTPSAAA